MDELSQTATHTRSQLYERTMELESAKDYILQLQCNQSRWAAEIEDTTGTIRSQALLLNKSRVQTIALKNSLKLERMILKTTKQLWAKDKELSALKQKLKSVDTLDKGGQGPRKEEKRGHLLDLSLPNPVGLEKEPPAYGSVCDDSNKIPYGGTNVDSQSYIRRAMDMLQRSQETQLKQIIVNRKAVNSEAVFPSSMVAAPTRTER